MGKVLASGHAKRDFTPDVCTISISVETRGMTAAKAVLAARTEFERLLSELSDLGIHPESMSITDDHTDRPRYRDGDDYSSERTIRIHMPINAALVNQIHGIIASGFENVTMHVGYDIASRSERIRELTRLAIQDSRRTAELLAEATGGNIIGIDSANLEGDEDMDIADLDIDILNEKDEPCYMRKCMSAPSTPFADRLSPEKVTLEADVRIVWNLFDG